MEGLGLGNKSVGELGDWEIRRLGNSRLWDLEQFYQINKYKVDESCVPTCA